MAITFRVIYLVNYLTFNFSTKEIVYFVGLVARKTAVKLIAKC